MASPLVLLRRSVFSFSVGLLPDSLQSTTLGRSSLRLCRACSSVRGARGAGEGPALKARERRMERYKLLRRNRRDLALERAARTGTRELVGTFALCGLYRLVFCSYSPAGGGPERVAGTPRAGPAANSRWPLQPLPGCVRRASVPTSRLHGRGVWREEGTQRNHPYPL